MYLTNHQFVILINSGSTIHLECNTPKSSIAWVKLIESGEAELLSIDGENPEEVNYRNKYVFTKSADNYVITIKNIQFQVNTNCYSSN